MFPAPAGSINHSLSIGVLPEELSRPQVAQAPASCLVVISAVGCFVTCPRKGELWGPWGKPEFLWLGSHRFTLLPEPTGSGMGLDEKQGLGHRSWAAPENAPPPATSCHSL